MASFAGANQDLINKMNKTYSEHYQQAKASNFDGERLRSHSVSAFQSLNKEAARIRQSQFAAISKKMYQEHERAVKDGKFKNAKKNSERSEKEEKRSEEKDQYSVVSGASTTTKPSKSISTGMSAGATQGAKVVTFGSSSQQTLEQEPKK